MSDLEPPGKITGKLKGGNLEKIFFGDSRFQLQSFWGIKDFKDLEKADHIILPQTTQEYVKVKLDDTIDDGHERTETFGYEKDNLTISDEGQSETSLRDFIGSQSITNVINVALENENPLKFSWYRLFGKPKPIHFHTHPSFRREDISALNMTFQDGSILRVSPENCIQWMDFVLGTFSRGDLMDFLQSSRYFNSALLASKERLLYLVSPDLNLQIGIQKFNTLPHEYERRLQVVITSAMVKLFGIDLSRAELFDLKHGRNAEILEETKQVLSTDPTIDDLIRMRDQVLIDTANEAGYLGFASDSPEDGILTRKQ